jgi:high-affinity nickel-transport protein
VNLAVLVVFVLGMRQGADPDHLAAIDNITRNSHAYRPKLSRLTGLFFAAGHSLAVIGLAALLSSFSKVMLARAHRLEDAGSYISVAILLFIGCMNVRALARRSASHQGMRSKLLPRILREASNPLMAAVVGLLFGVGFETSSQLAAYGFTLSQGGGLTTAIAIGLAFGAGMMVTDILDSFLVHHIVSHRMSGIPGIARFWQWIVTIFAFAAAAYELAPYLGVHTSTESDLYFGLGLVAVLLAAFVLVFFIVRGQRDLQPQRESLPRG